MSDTVQTTEIRLAMDALLVDLITRRVAPGASEEEARDLLSKYITPKARPLHVAGTGGIYHQVAHSAQDYGMAPTVVGKAMGGVEKLEPVLFGFDPVRVAAAYPSGTHWEALLDRIVDELAPRGKVRRESRSIWPKYCRSLISGAHFLARFESATAFYGWADAFNGAVALPISISREIVGFGFPLSCIFLMDLGFGSYLKPDVWVIRFCNRMGIAEGKDPLAIFEAATRVANEAGLTPLAFDRMIWLICTGEFWLDRVDLGSQLEAFVTSWSLACR